MAIRVMQDTEQMANAGLRANAYRAQESKKQVKSLEDQLEYWRGHAVKTVSVPATEIAVQTNIIRLEDN